MRNTFLCITFVLFGLTLIDIKQFLLHLVLLFDEFAHWSHTAEDVEETWIFFLSLKDWKEKTLKNRCHNL